MKADRTFAKVRGNLDWRSGGGNEKVAREASLARKALERALHTNGWIARFSARHLHLDMIVQLATEHGGHSLKNLMPSIDNLLGFDCSGRWQRPGPDLGTNLSPRRWHLIELLHARAWVEQKSLEFAEQ